MCIEVNPNASWGQNECRARMSAGVVRLELELDILAGRSSGGAGPPGSRWALILLVKCYWKDSIAWIVSRILVLVIGNVSRVP